VSRPTDLSKFQEADRWMVETFGSGMATYLAAEDADPVGVAIVEVEKLLKKTQIDALIEQWRREDAKSNAGAKPIITRASALRLILLQLRLRRPTMITEIGDTFRRLSPTQKKILGIRHDGEDLRIYSRIWEAIQGLMRLVDEFPGRRDKILTSEEYRAVVEARDQADCKMRRERMFTLANALLEGSRQLLPKELRDRSDGNIALDATFVPLYGKTGNPSSKNLDAGRQSANYDGGWYQREGSHGAVTHADAAKMNESDPESKKKKGTSADKRWWGLEIEIARGTANLGDVTERFPLLTYAMSFHPPGEVVGEGLRIAQSLIDRGHKPNLFIVDRAYSNGLYDQYTVPIRLLGYKHVFTYKEDNMGLQGHDPRGLVQVGGAWYLDTLPEVLRGADKVISTARAVFKSAQAKAKWSKKPAAELAKEYAQQRKDVSAAEDRYSLQRDQRAKYRLLPKGVMADDWTRRYIIPTDAPGYAVWKKKPGSHQGVTLTMKRPVGDQIKVSNAGGLKHEQYFPWGTDDWMRANGLRNGVESVNRNLKRSQYEDMADPDSRAVRGNTFTYLVAALSTVVENLRQIKSFFKRQLATVAFTAKNKNTPSAFWQLDESTGEQLVATRQPG
jgi:hypothetical protein